MQEPISNAFPFSSKPGLMGPKARTITDSKSVLSLFSTDPPSRLGQIRERTDLGSVIVRVFGPIRPFHPARRIRIAAGQNCNPGPVCSHGLHASNPCSDSEPDCKFAIRFRVSCCWMERPQWPCNEWVKLLTLMASASCQPGRQNQEGGRHRLSRLQ